MNTNIEVCGHWLIDNNGPPVVGRIYGKSSNKSVVAVANHAMSVSEWSLSFDLYPRP